MTMNHGEKNYRKSRYKHQHKSNLSLTTFYFFILLIRFSAKVLTALCEQIESIPISGVIVVGDGQAAKSIALSGNAMKVPVLWAKGGSAQLHGGGSEVRFHSLNDTFNLSIHQCSVTRYCFTLHLHNVVSMNNPTFHMSSSLLIYVC